MVARVDVRRNKRGLDRAERMAREWPEVVWTAALNTQRVVEPKMLNDLAQPAPRPTYPIDWQTERQRRAYFATNGFGRGIPTKRTGGATTAWKGSLTRGNGVIVSKVTNPNDYLIYVRYTRRGQASRIQRMHAGRWRNANAIIDRHRREWLRIYPINLGVERRRRFK